MRQINFVIMFVMCLALVLFGLENSQPTEIRIISGVELQAPLCVILMLSMGLGALLAWVINVWMGLQAMLLERRGLKTIRHQEAQIKTLEKDLQEYKVELQVQRRLIPAAVEASPTPVSEAP